jgi:predicted methyltransferase
MFMDIPTHIQQAVQSNNRPTGDRERDRFRKPAEVLTFFQIEAGDKVGELNAGRGYVSGIAAAAVGTDGFHVFRIQLVPHIKDIQGPLGTVTNQKPYS